MIEKLKNPLSILLFLLYHYHEKGQLLQQEKDLLKIELLKENKLLISLLPILPKKREEIDDFLPKIKETIEKIKLSSEIGSEISNDLMSEEEEKELNAKKNRNRYKSELVDLNRGSFSDYAENVLDEFYKFGSADDIDENYLEEIGSSPSIKNKKEDSTKEIVENKHNLPNYKCLKSFKKII